MGLDAAAFAAFWGIYDATQIRPEYLIPVLAYESGLRPDLQNRAGADYWGINQLSGSSLRSQGIDPQSYLTWSASQQLEGPVKSYFQGQVGAFGSLNSGIRVYQAEFYPASLNYATGLDDVIVSGSSSDPQARGAYFANRVFDKSGKGYITPRDLGVAIESQLQKSYVQAAISNTYALRPGEVQQDPIYGTDFGAGSIATVTRPLLLATSVLVLAGILAEAISPGSSPFSPRRRARIFAI